MRLSVLGHTSTRAGAARGAARPPPWAVPAQVPSSHPGPVCAVGRGCGPTGAEPQLCSVVHWICRERWGLNRNCSCSRLSPGVTGQLSPWALLPCPGLKVGVSACSQPPPAAHPGWSQGQRWGKEMRPAAPSEAEPPQPGTRGAVAVWDGRGGSWGPEASPAAHREGLQLWKSLSLPWDLFLGDMHPAGFHFLKLGAVSPELIRALQDDERLWASLYLAAVRQHLLFDWGLFPPLLASPSSQRGEV